MHAPTTRTELCDGSLERVCVSEIGLAPMMRCPWTRARNTHQRDARMWPWICMRNAHQRDARMGNTHAACICCRAGFPTELVDLTASIEEYGNVSGIYAALHRGDVDIYPEARRTPRRRQRAAEGDLPCWYRPSPAFSALSILQVWRSEEELFYRQYVFAMKKNPVRAPPPGASFRAHRSDAGVPLALVTHVARRCADPTLGPTGSDGPKRVRLAATPFAAAAGGLSRTA